MGSLQPISWPALTFVSAGPRPLLWLTGVNDLPQHVRENAAVAVVLDLDPCAAEFSLLPPRSARRGAR